MGFLRIAETVDEGGGIAMVEPALATLDDIAKELLVSVWWEETE